MAFGVPGTVNPLERGLAAPEKMTSGDGMKGTIRRRAVVLARPKRTAPRRRDVAATAAQARF